MAHMIEQPPLTTVRDPVCGMEMARSDAVAMRQLHGVTHYFCSHDCAVAFDADPARYVAPVSATTGVGAGGASVARIALPIADLRRSGAPALQHAIGAVPGVSGANVNIKDGRVFVDYDPSRANVADLMAAVRGAGFTPSGQSLRLKIAGLYCAECVSRIEDALKAVPGVLDATMSAASNEVRVDYTPAVGDLRLLTQAVERAGPYTATRAAEASEPELDKEAAATETEYRALMRKWWFAAAVGAPTMILSYPYLIPGLRD
jgi:P-type Cu+ transporter